MASVVQAAVHNVSMKNSHRMARAITRRCSRYDGRHFSSTTSSTTCTSSSNDNTKFPPLYVAATRQHVGKTSVSLALVHGLQERLGKNRVGFMKPVGQQSLQVTEDDGTVVNVDKDTALLVEYFGLQQQQTQSSQSSPQSSSSSEQQQHNHHRYQDASPVLIPPGYTKAYVDGEITLDHQKQAILNAYANISSQTDIVVSEGTGHCAVGAIVDASNAAVASWMRAKMVLVANGGLGNTIDELELNKTLCDKHGVEIAGVVINKVLPEKYEQTQYYLGKALSDRWGIPLLGVVPDRSFLGCPALCDMERLFPGASFVSGHAHRLRHYTVDDLNLVATSLEVFLKNLRHDPKRTLYVCHASRNDILLGFLMESQQRQGDADWEAALLVTGCEEYPISTQVLEIVQSMSHPTSSSSPPIILCPPPTRQVMHDIIHFTPKLNFQDDHRVASTIAHYSPHIDFDLLLERMMIMPTTGSDSERTTTTTTTTTPHSSASPSVRGDEQATA